MRLFLYRLRRDRSLQRIVIPIALIFALSIVTAMTIDTINSRRGSLLEKADRLSSMGEFANAERFYWAALQSAPVDVPTLIGFIDNRASLIESVMVQAMSGANITTGAAVSSEDYERLFQRSDMDPDVAVLGRYWASVRLGWGEYDPGPATQLADRDPPVRHANRLLARAALLSDDYPRAARRFEKEGLAFEEGIRDLDHAIDIWIELEAWDEVRERIDDPRYSNAIGAAERRALAEHDRDWLSYLLWLWPASFAGTRLWPVALAILAGGLWFAIAASLGGVSVRPRRMWLYSLSFILGMLSVYPTLVVITIEERLFNLQFTGEPVADAIYFVVGVGVREEFCKFLLFLPLLPLLRKRGSRIEALICAAMVGLGFAAEENINYFHRMDMSAALGRFLTANFLHMALTGLIGLAAYDSDRPNRDSFDLNTTFLLAVLIHGAYDFFLASPAVGEYSIFSMTVFILLSQRFLREVLSSSATPPDSVLRLFIISITLLTGASYVYATTLVGPWTALQLIAVGVVGQAILIYMFVLELGGVK